jgi:hypothetical protein
MHAFVGQDATSIVLGESIGGLRDIMFRRGSEARSKYFSAWSLGGLLLLGGGLEPHFRVLFSAVFQGVSLGNFHQGRNLRKVAEAKVWSILVNSRTFFMCVLIIFI